MTGKQLNVWSLSKKNKQKTPGIPGEYTKCSWSTKLCVNTSEHNFSHSVNERLEGAMLPVKYFCRFCIALRGFHWDALCLVVASLRRYQGENVLKCNSRCDAEHISSTESTLCGFLLQCKAHRHSFMFTFYGKAVPKWHLCTDGTFLWVLHQSRGTWIDCKWITMMPISISQLQTAETRDGNLKHVSLKTA